MSKMPQVKKAVILFVLILLFQTSVLAGVAAKVGPYSITDEDIEREFKLYEEEQYYEKYLMLDPSVQKSPEGLPAGMPPHGQPPLMEPNSFPHKLDKKGILRIKKQILDGLIQSKLIYIHAKENNFEEKPEIKKKIAENIAEMKKGLIVVIYMNNFEENIKISQKELKDYYQKNKWRFKISGDQKINVRVIVVFTEKEALAARQRILGGETFNKVAKEVSRESHAAKGGKLGWVRRGDRQFPLSIREQVFALNKKDLSMPIKSKQGYYLIKVYDKKEPEFISFSKAKKQISFLVKQDKIQKETDRLIADLKKKITVKKYKYK